jgi:hypothetical protein
MLIRISASSLYSGRVLIVVVNLIWLQDGAEDTKALRQNEKRPTLGTVLVLITCCISE